MPPAPAGVLAGLEALELAGLGLLEVTLIGEAIAHESLGRGAVVGETTLHSLLELVGGDAGGPRSVPKGAPAIDAGGLRNPCRLRFIA